MDTVILRVGLRAGVHTFKTYNKFDFEEDVHIRRTYNILNIRTTRSIVPAGNTVVVRRAYSTYKYPAAGTYVPADEGSRPAAQYGTLLPV